MRAERATIPFVTADKVAESAAIRDGLLAQIRRRRAEFESAGDKAEKERTLLTSPMQQYLRDLLATRQHIGLSEENYERAGRFRIQASVRAGH